MVPPQPRTKRTPDGLSSLTGEVESLHFYNNDALTNLEGLSGLTDVRERFKDLQQPCPYGPGPVECHRRGTKPVHQR